MVTFISCLCWLWLIICASAAVDQLPCPKTRAVLRLPGQATIAAIFDGHLGLNCTQPVPIGLQQMAATAWIVNALNEMKFLSGVKLGLSLYNSCSSPVGAQKTLVAAVVDLDCEDTYSLGLTTTPSILASFQTLPNDLHILVVVTPMLNSDKLLVHTTIAFLTMLHWSTVNLVLAPTVQLLDSFSQASRSSKLCVLDKNLLPTGSKQNWTSQLKTSLEAAGNESIVVAMGSWQQITTIVQVAKELNIEPLQWVFLPLDAWQDVSSLANVPLESFVILPGLAILQQERIKATLSPVSTEEFDMNLLDSEERLFINYPLFISVAVRIIEIANKFKISLLKNCGYLGNSSITSVCKQMPPFITIPTYSSTEFSSETVTLEQVLNSSDRIALSAISRVTTGVEGKNLLQEIGVYEDYVFNVEELLNIKLKLVKSINNISLSDKYCKLDISDNSSTERNCSHCNNFAHYFVEKEKQTVIRKGISPMVTWRPDAWVAAVASISAIGTICSIVIAIFIAIRLCKGDMLEGNPSFSFLLLLSVVFTYSSTLPFSLALHNDHYLGSFFCALRITGTSLSYAFLFSIMLSRSFMLASCDQDGGFMSHINGYLQSVLCFFIISVQLALSAQFWVINSSFLDVSQCTSMYEGYYFQILLCYDIFLLILLVCISPLTVRSKRNYREGVFFMSASILSLLIWVGWTTAYFLVPRAWQDAAICGGLAATATGILVTVFIPRTYLMVTAIVRDNLASALPSLACTNSTSVLDLNYRATSSQVLYDCVNSVMTCPSGQVNPNFYSEQPQIDQEFVSENKPKEQERPITPNNDYERYESPTSLNKVTHF